MLRNFLIIFLIIGLFSGCSKEKPPEEKLIEQANQVQQDEVYTSVASEKPIEWGNTPDFTAIKVGGGEFQLSSLMGKVIILNFWAVDCPACRMQISDLAKLYEKYNNSGLEVIGISLDSAFLIQSYIGQKRTQGEHINYTLLLGNREFLREYGRELRFIPTTFIIDKKGEIEEKFVGYVSKDKLEKKINELLSK